MTVDNYLAEVPTVFNELSRQFGGQTERADGVLESHAGKLAADVLAHLLMLVNNGQITINQFWAAIAAERGSVGACNMIANLARAAQGQLIENTTTQNKEAPLDTPSAESPRT